MRNAEQRLQFNLGRLMAATAFAAVAMFLLLATIRYVAVTREKDDLFWKRFGQQNGRDIGDLKCPTFVDLFVVPTAMIAGIVAAVGASVGVLFGHARRFATTGAITTILAILALWAAFVWALSGLKN